MIRFLLFRYSILTFFLVSIQCCTRVCVCVSSVSYALCAKCNSSSKPCSLRFIFLIFCFISFHSIFIAFSVVNPFHPSGTYISCSFLKAFRVAILALQVICWKAYEHHEHLAVLDFPVFSSNIRYYEKIGEKPLKTISVNLPGLNIVLCIAYKALESINNDRFIGSTKRKVGLNETGGHIVWMRNSRNSKQQ